MSGALPDQEMCEHCTSYDGGYPCHMCGALSPADRQNPEALRRAADVIEELLARAPRTEAPGFGGFTTAALAALKERYGEDAQGFIEDPWMKGFR